MSDARDPSSRIASIVRLAERRPPPSMDEIQGLRLTIGSDVEIARRVAEDLEAEFGQIVFDEGDFWHYDVTHWRAIEVDALWRKVMRYDGAAYETPKGDPAVAKLGSGRVKSIIDCMRPDLVEVGFFADRTEGINCRSGLIVLDGEGVPSLLPHDRDHRQRHTLGGHWDPDQPYDCLPRASLLNVLFHGCFLGDADADQKVKLLAQVAGVAALGAATKLTAPKALVLVGETAENGKTQILEVFRSLIPPGGCAAIPPDRFNDEKSLVTLPGKLLNAPDELSGIESITSDNFKKIITGDPVLARDVYKSAVIFSPTAQHVLSTNVLPAFKGGMDRGVRRRLLPMSCNRTIPPEERIANIGKRIGEEEPDLLLAWAVWGASIAMKHRRFVEPASGQEDLKEWALTTDPVLAWMDCDEVTVDLTGAAEIRTAEAHAKFVVWATKQGFKGLPQSNGFTQRVKASNQTIKRLRDGRGPYFTGLICSGPSMLNMTNQSSSDFGF